VLGKASAARIFDWYPLFHYAFIHYHFRKDPATGADPGLVSAVHNQSC